MEVFFKDLDLLGYFIWLGGIAGITLIFRYFGEYISEIGMLINDLPWLGLVFSIVGSILIIPSMLKLVNIYTNENISFINNLVTNFYKKYPLYDGIEMIVGLILIWLFFVENASRIDANEIYLSFNGLVAIVLFLYIDFLASFLPYISLIHIVLVVFVGVGLVLSFVWFKKLINYSNEFKYFADESKIDTMVIYLSFITLLEPQIFIVMSIIYLFQKVLPLFSEDLPYKIFRNNFFSDDFLSVLRFSSSFFIYLMILKMFFFPFTEKENVLQFGIYLFFISFVFLLLYTFKINTYLFLLVSFITNVYFLIYLPATNGLYINLLKDFIKGLLRVKIVNFHFFNMNLGWLFLPFVYIQAVLVFSNYLEKSQLFKKIQYILLTFSFIPFFHLLVIIVVASSSRNGYYHLLGLIPLRIGVAVLIIDVFVLTFLTYMMNYIEKKAKE